MQRLVIDARRCVEFVQRYEPLVWSEDMKAIGLEREGELIMATVYEGWSGPNIWIHVAKDPAAMLVSRNFLAAVFHYPFVQVGVRRLTAYTEESNVRINSLLRRLGFEPEARLAGAARGGGDVIIHRMLREQCRFVAPRSA